MQVYMYEGTYTQKLEDYVEGIPNLRTLVMELFYRYGLKAFDLKESSNYDSTLEILLTIDGHYYGSAWVEKEDKYNDETDETKTTYTNCFMSKTYRKARGSDNRDRHTLRSKHLSTLMRNIDNCEAVPSSILEVTDGYTAVKRMISYIENSKITKAKADNSKRYADLQTDDIQMMMAYMAGERKLIDIPQEVKNRCKATLDKWKEVDKNTNSYMDYMRSMFETPVYVVSASKARGYVIGKLQVSPESNEIEEVEPWRRVMTVEDYESDELNSLFTIFKVRCEAMNDHRYRTEQMMYYSDTFLEDLDMVTYYESTDSYYGGAWLLLPTTIPQKDLGETS